MVNRPFGRTVVPIEEALNIIAHEAIFSAGK
jgi:hypothetical protein